MGKYGLIVVLIITLIFSGTVYYMVEQVPKVQLQVLNIAEKSYFLGCMNSLIFSGMPKDESLTICNADSKEYMEQIANIMKDDNY